MIEKILDIIFPKLCLNCGKQGEGYICSSCFLALNFKFKILKMKNKPFENLVYLEKYGGDVRDKLLQFKFYDKAYINEYFLEIILKDKNVCDFLKKFDMIIPVPMHKNKKVKRGYNQTELIASKLSKKLGLEYAPDVLLKTKENQTQSLLNEEERKQNVRGVFEIQNENKIFEKNVILLDDIFTTGSTISECSSLLKHNGVKKICGLVIAKK